MQIHSIKYYPNKINFSSHKKFYEQKGYVKINTIEMKNEYNETVIGDIYKYATDDSVMIISTDDKGNHIGELSAHKHISQYNYGTSPTAYFCSINNFATKHQEKNLHGKHPLTNNPINHKYSGVGTKLYEELETHLKENHPEVTELRIYALNYGSWLFHSKIGFVGYDEYDFWDPLGLGNEMYKKLK